MAIADGKHQITRGFASKASPLTAELFAVDSREVPHGLLQTGNYTPPLRDVTFTRYVDPAFAALERERLWKNTWQFACREEDIPNVGDRYRYDVGTLSWFVVRSAPNGLRAFNNACLHRGTQLCSADGSAATIRCPFHGWEWSLDGRLKHIPSHWDFKGVRPEEYRLPEAQVATWGGFIFIHPDPNAAPLKNFLGVLPEHFSSWGPEERFTALHIRKLVRANWKISMEAFLEAYHVVETHSESLPFTGDASSQYDVWDAGDAHISRAITPSAVPSPHLGDDASVVDAANRAFQAFAMATPGVPIPCFDAQSPLSARAQVAEWRRQTMGGGLGRDLDSWSDATMLDSIQYYMFPNFFPWYGEGLPLVYQFLPYQDDPNESVMNVRLTVPVPGKGAPRPPAAKICEIGFDQAFHTIPGLGLLATIFDQDMSNIPRVQRGIKAASGSRAKSNLGRYQEQRITHFHEILDRTLGIGSGADGP